MNDGDITTGAQIDSYLKKYFPLSVYRGITLNDDFPKLKNGQFIINNKRTHWTAVYNLNGLKEYDSYGRDMVPEIPETYIKPSDIQGASEADAGDCGQRTVSKMIEIFKPSSFANF